MDRKTYEGMFMIEPTKASQEWDNIKKQIASMIERRDGVIISARKWGERKLAYEIAGHKRAAYLLIYFDMPPQSINVLRRDLQLSELVMRTLILLQSKPIIRDEVQKQEQNFDDKAQDTEETESTSEDTFDQEYPQEEDTEADS